MVSGDLWDQCRVLYVLYEALNEHNRRWLSSHELYQDKNIKFMKLEPVLFYLESGEFITVRGSNIALTQKGLRTIISIFRKFVFFLNQEHYERVSSWIGQFDVNKNNDWGRTRDVFFFIKTEPEIEKPFIEYLKSFQYIDEVDKLDLSGGFTLWRGYTHLRNECNAFFNDNSKYSKNTFIMTKFVMLSWWTHPEKHGLSFGAPSLFIITRSME